MRPDPVVVDPPSFDLLPGILQAQEPLDVQALASERTVERLDEGVLRRGTGTREVHGDSLLVHPGRSPTNVPPLPVWRRLGSLGGKFTHDVDDLLSLDVRVGVNL